MKPTLYVETSIVSYYTGRPSRDLIIAARQQITRDWWEKERQKYSLHISALVLRESQRGEPAAVKRRADALKGIPLVGMTVATQELAETGIQNSHVTAQAAILGGFFGRQQTARNPFSRRKRVSSCVRQRLIEGHEDSRYPSWRNLLSEKALSHGSTRKMLFTLPWLRQATWSTCSHGISATSTTQR